MERIIALSSRGYGASSFFAAANAGARSTFFEPSLAHDSAKRRNLCRPGFRLSITCTAAFPKDQASESIPVDSAVTYRCDASDTNAGIGLKRSFEYRSL